MALDELASLGGGDQGLAQTITRIMSDIEQEITRLRTAKDGGRLEAIAQAARAWLEGHKRLQEVHARLGWCWIDDPQYVKMLQRAGRVLGEPWASEYAAMAKRLHQAAARGDAGAAAELGKLGESLSDVERKAVEATKVAQKAAQQAARLAEEQRLREIIRAGEEAAKKVPIQVSGVPRPGDTILPGSPEEKQMQEVLRRYQDAKKAQAAKEGLGIAQSGVNAIGEVEDASKVITAAEEAQAAKAGAIGKIVGWAKRATDALTKIPVLGPLLKGGSKALGIILGNALVVGVGTAAGAAEGVENIVKLGGAVSEALLAAGAAEVNGLKVAAAQAALEAQQQIKALEKGLADASAQVAAAEAAVDAGNLDAKALEARRADYERVAGELDQKRREMRRQKRP